MDPENFLKKKNLHEQGLLKTKLEVQERAYQRISEELHDNIGQVLTLIKLYINTIDISQPEKAKEKLFEAKILLSQVLQDLRDLAIVFNTDFIKQAGLVTAIEQLLQLLRRTGLYSLQWSIIGEIVGYGCQRELAIFRIVQELLNNVVKHANATTINIVMEYRPDKLIITVEDNGTGFDFQKQECLDSKSLGLRNIHDRIKLLNGAIFFESELQKGTTVKFEVAR